MASGAHLSRQLFDLVKSIGQSRSKQQQDRIITAQKSLLKSKISEQTITPKRMKQCLIRAIYCQMLGHSAQFAHIHAVKFTHSKNVLNKRIGYLASSLFLDSNSSMVVLMVATIQQDLKSPNQLIVQSALSALIRIINPSIIQAVIQPILDLLGHSSENVRKKAVFALNCIYKLNSSSVGEGVMLTRMKKALCDRDPSVMAATLNFFKEEISKAPDNFKDLISSFVVILKQIIEHKLPKEFQYHRMPAPWIQMKILEILSILGAGDQASSDNMYEVVSLVLRKADSLNSNIGYTLVYQCVKTLVTIYPSQLLLDTAVTNISRFLHAESKNLRYIGIDALTQISKIDPKYTLNYQDTIINCLEDPDDTLKSKTLQLIYRITNKQNVDFIIDRTLKFLKSAPAESKLRQTLVKKICINAQLYAKNKATYIRIMNRIFQTAGDLINQELLSKVIKLIASWKNQDDKNNFQDYTVSTYMKILTKNQVIPDSMLRLIAWVLGEFMGGLGGQSQKVKIIKIIRLLCETMKRPVQKQETLAWVLQALSKLHKTIGFSSVYSSSQAQVKNPFIELQKIIESYSRSKNVELQQRCREYLAMKKLYFSGSRDALPDLSNSVFLTSVTSKQTSEDQPKPEKKVKQPVSNLLMVDDDFIQINNKQLQISDNSQNIDPQLSFLDSFVQQAIDQGATEYKRCNPGIDRRNSGWAAGISNSITPSVAPSSSGGLNFGPYQAPNTRAYKIPQRETVEQRSLREQNPASVTIGNSTALNLQTNNTFANRIGTGLNAKTNKWTMKGYAEKQNQETVGINNPGPSFAQQDYQKISLKNFELTQTKKASSSVAVTKQKSKNVKEKAKLFGGINNDSDEDNDDDDQDDEFEEEKAEKKKQGQKVVQQSQQSQSLLQLQNSPSHETPSATKPPENMLQSNELLTMFEQPSQPAPTATSTFIPPPPITNNFNYNNNAIIPPTNNNLPMNFSAPNNNTLPFSLNPTHSQPPPPQQQQPPQTQPKDPFEALTKLAQGGSLLSSQPPNSGLDNILNSANNPISNLMSPGSLPTSLPSAPMMSPLNFSLYTLSTQQFGQKWLTTDKFVNHFEEEEKTKPKQKAKSSDIIDEDQEIDQLQNLMFSSSSIATKENQGPTNQQHQGIKFKSLKGSSSSSSSKISKSTAPFVPSSSLLVKQQTMTKNTTFFHDYTYDPHEFPPSLAGKFKNPLSLYRSSRIQLEESKQCKNLLFNNEKGTFSKGWRQGFYFARSSGSKQCGTEQSKQQVLPFLQQRENFGPNGILSVVQAHLLKHLLFVSKFDAKSLRDKNEDKFTIALMAALTDILVKISRPQASKKQDDQLTLQSKDSEQMSNDSTKKQVYGFYLAIPDLAPPTNPIQPIQCLLYKVPRHSWYELFQLLCSLRHHYMEPGGHGVLLMLYSIIFTHRMSTLRRQMTETGRLIDENGMATQQLINLLNLGKAHGLVNDAEKKQPGVTRQSNIGFLTAREMLRKFQVGDNLKTPILSIWIVQIKNGEYGVLFIDDLNSMNKRYGMIQMLYYEGAGKLFHEDDDDNKNVIEIKIESVKDIDSKIDPHKLSSRIQLLQSIIKTRWGTSAKVQCLNNDYYC